jgi:hypothetical protein
MRTLAIVVGLLAFALTLPSAASARPCSDTVPVIIAGQQWIVYTGDSARERREIPCSKARSIAKRYIRTGDAPSGWKCSHTLRLKRCVRGGTYVDDYGYRQWRYLIGWHHAD